MHVCWVIPNHCFSFVSGLPWTAEARKPRAVNTAPNLVPPVVRVCIQSTNQVPFQEGKSEVGASFPPWLLLLASHIVPSVQSARSQGLSAFVGCLGGPLTSGLRLCWGVFEPHTSCGGLLQPLPDGGTGRPALEPQSGGLPLGSFLERSLEWPPPAPQGVLKPGILCVKSPSA